MGTYGRELVVLSAEFVIILGNSFYLDLILVSLTI